MNLSNKVLCDQFRNNIKFDGQRYQVELPYKSDHPVLCDNYNLNKSRFLALEKKFMKG